MKAVLELFSSCNILIPLLAVIPLSILAFKVTIHVKLGDPDAIKLRYQLKVVRSRSRLQEKCPHAEIHDHDSNLVLSLLEQGDLYEYCTLCHRPFDKYEVLKHVRSLANVQEDLKSLKKLQAAHRQALHLRKKFNLLESSNELI